MPCSIAHLAVFLGLLFEVTVYGWTPGIGHLAFWLGALTVTALANRAAERPALPAPWMFVPALFFAASLALYDASVVRVWSTVLGLLTLLWAVGWNLTAEREPGALAGLFPPATFGPVRLWREGRATWRPVLSTSARPSEPVLRGVLLALPLLLVFGILLASADLVFARTLGNLLRGLEELPYSLPLRLGFWLLLFAGWLRLWLTSGRAEAPQSRSPFGVTEMLVAVGSVNVLLLIFLAIQARYLFGGAALVEALGLNYAEYARKGFFELSACIALILPLVMLAYQTSQSRRPGPLLEGDEPEGRSRHLGTSESAPSLRWAGGALVLQAGGLAFSAFRRMLLYIGTFGLSVERFYAAAGILVALTLLAWAAYACLRPQEVSWVLARQSVTVVFLVSALSLLNVEDAICRYNLGRAAQGQSLDIAYLATLSCDAVPALLAAPPGLGQTRQKQCLEVAHHLKGLAGPHTGPGWNSSRVEAARLLREAPSVP